MQHRHGVYRLFPNFQLLVMSTRDVAQDTSSIAFTVDSIHLPENGKRKKGTSYLRVSPSETPVLSAFGGFWSESIRVGGGYLRPRTHP